MNVNFSTQHFGVNWGNLIFSSNLQVNTKVSLQYDATSMLEGD